jgi:hypothetical protein
LGTLFGWVEGRGDKHTPATLAVAFYFSKLYIRHVT